MRSKLKLSRSLELIPAFFKEQQVINTRGPPPVLIGLIVLSYLINNPRMFNLGIDDLTEKPYIPQKNLLL
jgi:hypothetical protein